MRGVFVFPKGGILRKILYSWEKAESHVRAAFEEWLFVGRSKRRRRRSPFY